MVGKTPGTQRLDRDGVVAIRDSIAVFRQLETKRQKGPLPPVDEETWMRLYRGVLSLFGHRHQTRLEQRQSMRIPLRARVDFNIDGEHFHSMSHDLSVQGVCVGYSRLIPMERDNQVVIQLPRQGTKLVPGDSSITTRAHTRWSDQGINRLGMEFLALSTADQETIEDALFTQIYQQTQTLLLQLQQLPNGHEV